MPNTDKDRSASLAERKKAANLVKVSCSVWVHKNDAAKTRKAMEPAKAYAAPWPP